MQTSIDDASPELPHMKPHIVTVKKFSTCLPIQMYFDLARVLRKPLSLAAEGEFDRGVMAAWVQEKAAETISGHGEVTYLHEFLDSRGLREEYNFFRESKRNPELLTLL